MIVFYPYDTSGPEKSYRGHENFRIVNTSIGMALKEMAEKKVCVRLRVIDASD